MILERVRNAAFGGETEGAVPGHFAPSDLGRMPVTVVFTTIEGTLVALNAAAALAKDLAAEVVVLVTEVVSFRYQVQGLRDPVAFFERLCEAIVAETPIRNVQIEVHLCRDQVQCLETALRPRSIVLIGARRCWWPWRERHLERALSKRGFQALLIYAGSSTAQSRSASLVKRIIDFASQSSR